jgi:hypothetical protein
LLSNYGRRVIAGDRGDLPGCTTAWGFHHPGLHHTAHLTTLFFLHELIHSSVCKTSLRIRAAVSIRHWVSRRLFSGALRHYAFSSLNPIRHERVLSFARRSQRMSWAMKSPQHLPCHDAALLTRPRQGIWTRLAFAGMAASRQYRPGAGANSASEKHLHSHQ